MVGILTILTMSVKNRGGGEVFGASQTKSVKHDESYLSTVPKNPVQRCCPTNPREHWAIPEKNKQGVGVDEGMEFLVELKKEHVEIPGVN